MDYISIVVALSFATVLFTAFTTLSRKTKKLPPGPFPLPVIGNLLQLIGSSEDESNIFKLTKIYGPIMSLKLGTITTVIVSSPSLAKEILQKHDLAFAGKQVPNAFHAHNHYKYSIFWQPTNSYWRSLRKILTTNIFTNKRLDANQHLRFTKVQEFIAYCTKSSETSEVIDIGQSVFSTNLNLLSNTIFSKDITDYYSESAIEFRDAIWNLMEEAANPNLADFFPILEKYDPQGIRGRMFVCMDKMLKIFGALITERLERRILYGATNNDVLDDFLNFCEDHPKQIDTKCIKHSILDLFIAGTDTTSSVIEWSMAELIKNPEIMRKAKNELEEVIGKGKPIQETDIARLPYLLCIVKETLRLHPPGPFLFPRKPEQDVEVAGYTLPKDCQVLINIWSLGRDPSMWTNPLKYMPERFQDSKIDIRGHNFEFLPFGSGRRICPGIPLAIKMVPLMLGSLINSFNWKLEHHILPQDLNIKKIAGFSTKMAYPLRAIPIPL